MLRRCDDPEWFEIMRTIVAQCERLRPAGEKAVRRGTMSEASCACLFALTNSLLPRVVVEIGTFIGTSTRVLGIGAEHVYTCDDRHDLLKGWPHITTYPHTVSTVMLTDLVRRGVVAELFFFDGRIQDEDVPLIRQLSAERAVYAFDDYEGNEKGVVNVRKLRPHLPGYVLVEPPDQVLGLASRTTIALLVPKDMA